MRRLERKGRSADHHHVDSEGSWAVSYGDMVTLLMSFFVLYFTVDTNKHNQQLVQQELMVRLTQSGMTLDEELADQRMSMGKEKGVGIEDSIVKELGGKVYKFEKGLLIDFTDVSFFDFGKIKLTKEGKAALDKFAKIYEPFAGSYRLQVQAFTDTRKVRNDNPRFKDNLELSALRSVASVRELQQAGVPLDKMKIAGFGELLETRDHILKREKNADPLRYTRKVVLFIEPIARGVDP